MISVVTVRLGRAAGAAEPLPANARRTDTLAVAPKQKMRKARREAVVGLAGITLAADPKNAPTASAALLRGLRGGVGGTQA
jgi:hypothetical protein